MHNQTRSRRHSTQTRTRNSNSWKAARTTTNRTRMMRPMNGSNKPRTAKGTRIDLDLNKTTRRTSNLTLLKWLPERSRLRLARMALRAQPNRKVKNCKQNISIKLHKCPIKTRALLPQEAPQDLRQRLSRPTRIHLRERKVQASPSNRPVHLQQPAQAQLASQSVNGSSNGRIL